LDITDSGRRGTAGISAPETIPTRDAEVLTRERDGFGRGPLPFASEPKLYPADIMERREVVPPTSDVKLAGRLVEEPIGESRDDDGSDGKLDCV